MGRAASGPSGAEVTAAPKRRSDLGTGAGVGRFAPAPVESGDIVNLDMLAKSIHRRGALTALSATLVALVPHASQAADRCKSLHECFTLNQYKCLRINANGACGTVCNGI